MEAVADTLEGIEGMLQEKAINVAKFMRNLDITIEAIKEAESRMARRRKAFGAECWLKDYISTSSG